MRAFILLPFLVALSQGKRPHPQNLPELPGPPYPDKFGHNRFGVKYDPAVHGSGNSGEYYDFAENVYPSNPPRASLSHWSDALRPFFSTRARLSQGKRQRQHRRSDNNGYYTIRTNVGGKKHEARELEVTTEQPPMSISQVYASAPEPEQPKYTTIDLSRPQANFFQPKAEGKKGQFAKTLSDVYNDYKPSEIVNEAIGGSGVAEAEEQKPQKKPQQQAAATEGHGDEDDYPPAFSRRPAPQASSSPPRGISGGRAPPSYYNGGSNSGNSRQPGQSLSSLYDMYEDAPYHPSPANSGRPSSSYRGGRGNDQFQIQFTVPKGVSVTGSMDEASYSSNGGGSGSGASSSPYLSEGYLPGLPPHMRGAGGSGSYSSSNSGYPGYNPRPGHPHIPQAASPYAVSPLGAAVSPLAIAPGLSIASPLASLGYLPPPGVYIPPNTYPSPTPSKSPDSDYPLKKLKRKRKKSAHVVLRNMILGKPRRPPPPRHLLEGESQKQEKVVPAPQTPMVVMPPPVTVVASPPVYPSPYATGGGRYPHSAYPPPNYPYSSGPSHSGPPKAVSQLAESISTLRDAITGFRERPPPPRYFYYPPPPPPPRPRPNPRPTSFTSASDGFETKEGSSVSYSSGKPGPVTQHLQDWPRIFTAMGSSVDAVAGGLHAVRKEISKMTGQTLAKGIMMGGTTAAEVSKGIAGMVTKIAAI